MPGRQGAALQRAACPSPIGESTAQRVRCPGARSKCLLAHQRGGWTERTSHQRMVRARRVRLKWCWHPKGAAAKGLLGTCGALASLQLLLCTADKAVRHRCSTNQVSEVAAAEWIKAVSNRRCTYQCVYDMCMYCPSLQEPGSGTLEGDKGSNNWPGALAAAVHLLLDVGHLLQRGLQLLLKTQQSSVAGTL